MVRVLLLSTLFAVVTSEEVSSLLQTRANNEADCVRKNKCTTTTTTLEEGCADYVCPASMKKDPHGECTSATCSDKDCCIATCAGFTCPRGMEELDEQPSQCNGYTCGVTECCQKQKATCAGFTCPRGMEELDEQPSQCNGYRCGVTECCQKQKPTCTGFRCPRWMQPKPASEQQCDGSVCKQDDCCKRRFGRNEEEPPPPAQTTTTTTTWPNPPGTNCEKPKGKLSMCHFWGEPHFATVFFHDHHIDERKRGGRIQGTRSMEFHERGIFKIARVNGHQVQAFFCPGPDIEVDHVKYNPTSSACALAILMKDKTKITMMRSPVTKAWNKKEWTNTQKMRLGDAGIMKIFINGEEKSWYDLSPNGVKEVRGVFNAIAANVGKEVVGEVVNSDTYVSQMHSDAPRGENKIATSPTCVGDLAGDRSLVADVSIPVIKGDHVHWPMVYEMSVTLLVSEYDKEGLCGDEDLLKKVKSPRFGRPGYLGNEVDKYRVEPKNSIFSTAEIASLCDSCAMNCQTYQAHHEHKGDFCTWAEYDLSAATASCADIDDALWKSTCIVEQCATQGNAKALVIAEKQFQEFLDQLPETR